MLFDTFDIEFEILDVIKCQRVKKVSPAICEGRGFAVLSCRLSGHSEITVGDRVLKPDADSYLFCPSGTKYTQYYFDEEMIAVHLNFTKNEPKGACLISSSMSDLKDDFMNLYLSWSEKRAGYLLKCKYIVYKIFYKLYSSNFEKSFVEIKSSMDYLYTNYRKLDFSIKRMIERSNLSEAYFRRIFKREYGVTIVEFVNRLRIECAKSLIEAGAHSVKEIALMSGFNDEKYFSQTFKKITGLSPSEYAR